MKTKAWVIVGVLVLLATVIIGITSVIKTSDIPTEAAEALDASSSVTLYSLQPTKENVSTEDRFYEYRVLGRTELHQTDARLVIDKIENAATHLWGLEIGASLCAFCWNSGPSYGARVLGNGHTYDFVICYKCGDMVVYRDTHRLAYIPHVQVQGLPPLFDGFLSGAKIPVVR